MSRPLLSLQSPGLSPSHPMSPNIRLETPPRPLAVVRRSRRDKRTSRKRFQTLVERCGKLSCAQQIPGAGRHIAVYLDDVINLEVGVELDAPFAGHGEVVGSTTPAGIVATTTHYGPYQLLHCAHDAIHQWCAANGHTLAAPSWEIYGHWER